MAILERIRAWARSIKRDIATLWFAARHPEVPWHAKAIAAAAVAYALSPIDLIPDFIPVLGYVDDLVIVPLGIMLAIRLVPRSVLEELRLRGDEAGRLPASKAGLAAILVLWLLGAAVLAWWVAGRIGR